MMKKLDVFRGMCKVEFKDKDVVSLVEDLIFEGIYDEEIKF